MKNRPLFPYVMDLVYRRLTAEKSGGLFDVIPQPSWLKEFLTWELHRPFPKEGAHIESTRVLFTWVRTGELPKPADMFTPEEISELTGLLKQVRARMGGEIHPAAAYCAVGDALLNFQTVSDSSTPEGSPSGPGENA